MRGYAMALCMTCVIVSEPASCSPASRAMGWPIAGRGDHGPCGWCAGGGLCRDFTAPMVCFAVVFYVRLVGAAACGSCVVALVIGGVSLASPGVMACVVLV